MLRWFPTFQVATTCFSCSPPDLNLVVTNFIFIYMHNNHCHQVTAHLQLNILLLLLLLLNIWCVRGPGSSVGIATELRTRQSRIESRWGPDIPPAETCPGAHPASCTMGTGSFLGVKCGRGVLLTTHPLLVPRSWKRRAIPLPTLWAHRACKGITLPLYGANFWKSFDRFLSCVNFSNSPSFSV